MKFDVPKNKYFNKRHENSNQIVLLFYKNICLIITYIKIRVPFQMQVKNSTPIS